MEYLKSQISNLKLSLAPLAALAILAALACRGRDTAFDPLALQWRIQPAPVLRIDAKIRDGLKITSRLYQGTYTEVITYGLQTPGQKAVTQDGGAITIEADSAELYVADNQPLELTGSIDRGVQLLNHKAPVTVRGRNIVSLDARNQKKDLKTEGVENVRVINLTGNLEVVRCGGRLEAANVEGDVRVTAVLGSVDVANLTGNFAGRGLGGAVVLSNVDGNTSLTGTGNVDLLSFGLELAGGFIPPLKERPQTEKILAAKGKSIRIQTTGRARLENVKARAVSVDAFGGLAIANLCALRAEAAGAAQCRVVDVQSPLSLRACRAGVLEGLEMDYELVDCAELMVRPAGEPQPKGLLRGCLNLVFWDTPLGSVTQEHSRNVIFAQRETGDSAESPQK